jgi:PAS domain S-box-containing protein
MKLFTKILVFFIGLIVFLSILRTYSGVRLLDQVMRDQVGKRLSSNLNMLTFGIDRELYHLEKHLLFISENQEFRMALKGKDWGAMGAIVDGLLTAEDVDMAVLADNAGRPVSTRRTDIRVALPSLGQLKRPDVTKGLIALDAGARQVPALFVSIPLREGTTLLGTFQAFIVIDRASVFAAAVHEVLGQDSKEPVYVSIFRQDKMLFSGLLPEARLQETGLTSEISRVLYQEMKPYTGTNRIEGVDYIVMYKPLRGLYGSGQWAYGIAINEERLLAIKTRLLITFIALSVFATAAAIAIAFLVTREIDPSLNRILAYCRDIEEGRPIESIEVGSLKIQEFRLVASALKKMGQSISEREETIARHVEEIRSINAALETQASLIKSERHKLVVILETMDDGLLTVDPKGIITFFNRAAEESTGIDRHAVIGRHYTKVFPALEPSNFDQSGPQEIEIDGPSISLFLKIYISPYSTEAAERGHIILFRDITKEKKIEEFKADFISSITHDIKSLLVPVKGFLGRILEDKYGPISEPLRRRLVSIEESTAKIYQMAENYLNISRIESGRLDLALAPAEINDLVAPVVQLYAPRVKFAPQGQLPLVLVDRSYIERVVANLVANALKFSPPESEVVIGAGLESNMVIISVTDHGVGIPADEIQLIFERYRRGSFGQKEDGSGLGLFIVKSVIRAHGGDIWVLSAVGRGSTFYFSLPVFLGEI